MTNPLSPEPAPVRAELIERLEKRAAAYSRLLSQPFWLPTRAHMESAKNELHEATAALSDDAKDKQIAALTAENFALSADQCEAGYGDERGNHRCVYQDRIASLEAELVRLKAGTEVGGEPANDLAAIIVDAVRNTRARPSGLRGPYVITDEELDRLISNLTRST